MAGTRGRSAESPKTALWVILGLCFQLEAVAAIATSSVKPIHKAPPVASKKSNKASLLFQGDVSITSDPLPGDTSLRELTRFFDSPDARVAFASGGEVEHCNEVSFTHEWESRWQECCDRWYGSSLLPQHGDTIFSVATFSHFPGLTVCTTVYAGCKTLSVQKGGSKLPSCCFLIIGQKQTAKGLPPVVWIFHKLMGTKPESTPTTTTTTTTTMPKEPWGPVKSYYTVEQLQHQGKALWNFRLDSSMQMKVDFPAVLLKSLPMSKKRAEATGSSTITKTVRKAGLKAMSAVQEAFLKEQSAANAKSAINMVSRASGSKGRRLNLLERLVPWSWVPIQA